MIAFASNVRAGQCDLMMRNVSVRYGVGILKVQEIIKMQEITKVPRTSEYMRGVINLRGKVMPVVSLRNLFGMEEAETSRNTCIIVMQVRQGESSVILGMIADKVSEVLEIGGEEIEPAPSFGSQVDTHFILGMAKTKDAVKILLDADKLIDEDAISSEIIIFYQPETYCSKKIQDKRESFSKLLLRVTPRSDPCRSPWPGTGPRPPS